MWFTIKVANTLFPSGNRVKTDIFNAYPNDTNICRKIRLATKVGNAGNTAHGPRVEPFFLRHSEIVYNYIHSWFKEDSFIGLFFSKTENASNWRHF